MKNTIKTNIFTGVASLALTGGLFFMAVGCTSAHGSPASDSVDKSNSGMEEHHFANEVTPREENLTASGSDEASNTIFTNPAQNCSTEMDISWLTAPGKLCKIEVIDESDPRTYIYDYEEGDINFPNDETDPVEITSRETTPGTIQPDDKPNGTFDHRPSQLANGRSVTESHLVAKHGYRLSNLKPNTDYTYRIITYDKETGQKEHSETHRFHTAGGDHWKAAILGDFHNYAPEPGRLKSAMGMIDVLDSVSGGIDWVLSTGDQCGWGGSLNFWTELSEQPEFIDYMWASVEGNHDSQDKAKDKTDSFFRDSHYFPRNGYPGQEGVTYWFRYGDVLFFMLNNESMVSRESQKEAEAWMEKVVAENPSKYIVVVEHHQWLIGTDGSNGQLDRWEKEFDKLGVDLAISGHNHAYLRTYPLFDRKPVEAEKGTYYVVTPSSDNERGRKLNPLKANKDLIATRWSEGSHTVGGMIMDVDPHRIAMTLYDRHGNVEDSFSVPAKR